MIESTNKQLLQLQDVTFEADGNRILDKLNLELWEGYVHAIVGPNGAGKSTLAYTIMGLSDYQDFSGRIRFAGQDLSGMSVDRRARLGITLGWQEPARFEGLTVQRFIQSAARDVGVDQLGQILQQVGLDPGRYMHRAVDRTLSGGERKKVELASIVALKPRLVVLDEPDSGIDVESLQRIHDAIGVLKQAGATVLLITHSQEVLSWAEHAFLMCSGTILDKGEIGKISRYFQDRCLPCDHRNLPSLDKFNDAQDKDATA
ncbi:MAG: ATP-binding cassette domain-containing protein [Phycisphaerae bacterium]